MPNLRKSFVVSAGMLVATISVAGFTQSPNERNWEKAAGGKMAFEVASVRLNPGPPQPSNFRLSPDDAYANTGGLLNADSPLGNYIEFAYKSSRHVNSGKRCMRVCQSG